MIGLGSAGFGVFATSQLARAERGEAAGALARLRNPAQKQPEAPGAAAPLSPEDEAKARSQSVANLKRIGLAMHNFATTTPALTFPAAAISKETSRSELASHPAAVSRAGGALQSIPFRRALG